MSPLSRLLALSPLSLFTKTPNVSQNSRSMSSSVPPSQVAIFAAGCFWGVEHVFLTQWPIKDDKGILKTAVGYTGGLCSGDTNHAEALRIEFDPSKVTYAELVEYFYRTHDPTTLNSQGPDRGTQYRSAIFFNTPEQEAVARRVTEEVQEKHFNPKGQKITTTIEAAGPWYDAEEYHQEYLFRNPSGYQCPTHKLHW
ncbi:methionine sulfoxide reductase A [Lactarius vividus]|nr:methionine sulfoxide reductase A [Lactarius vividus]